MSRGSNLSDLRRSHAAGIHDSTRTRTELRKEAIRMSEDNGYDDDEEYVPSSLDEEEPTPEDLAAIEAELADSDDWPYNGVVSEDYDFA